MVNKISNIKDRVIYFIENQSITKGIFFDKIGMSSANFRGNPKNTPLNSATIENIFTLYPELNIEWLITGKGDMLNSNKLMLSKSKIPLLPQSAQAGFNSFDISVSEKEIEFYFDLPFLKEKADFAVMVEGESMQPYYESGSYIICKKIEQYELKYERVYLISVNHSPMLKRIYPSINSDTILCRSDNPRFRDFEIRKDDVNAIAKILASVRFNESEY